MSAPADAATARVAARLEEAERHARQGDIATAIRLVESLASEAPHFWWIWEKLGELEARVKRYARAAAHFREAAQRKPNDSSLLYKWSRATFAAGQPQQAKGILDKAAQFAPSHEAILGLYAEIYEGAADWNNLARVADAWLRAWPQNPLPWMCAAQAQWETGYLIQAMQNYRKFLERGGKSATNLATFGRLCLTALAYDDAARALDEAERLDADCGHMLSAKATLSMFRGRFDEAQAYARRAIKVNPADVAALRVLVQILGEGITEEEGETLRRLSARGDVPVRERIAASFALADWLDAQQDTDAAFAAYEHANRLSAERAHAEGFRYDPALGRRQMERLMANCSAVPQSTPADTPPTPIFIVGMPRSGTTLVESILGAHSQVFACGERQAMRTVMQEFVALDMPLSRVASGIKERWRKDYVRELPDLGRAIAVTDKNPWNYDALGVILELFPQARVIHVRRDPVETGLSIYRNEFPKFAAFANRLDDIGHYYGEYARLMAHWRALLPARFMTVQYEELVAGFDDLAPKLLAFCGLQWEERCREFSATNRVIATMSAVQARRPLTDFRGRSGRYRKFLAPLVEALREANVDARTGALADYKLA